MPAHRGGAESQGPNQPRQHRSPPPVCAQDVVSGVLYCAASLNHGPAAPLFDAWAEVRALQQWPFRVQTQPLAPNRVHAHAAATGQFTEPRASLPHPSQCNERTAAPCTRFGSARSVCGKPASLSFPVDCTHSVCACRIIAARNAKHANSTRGAQAHSSSVPRMGSRFISKLAWAVAVRGGEGPSHGRLVDTMLRRVHGCECPDVSAMAASALTSVPWLRVPWRQCHGCECPDVSAMAASALALVPTPAASALTQRRAAPGPPAEASH